MKTVEIGEEKIFLELHDGSPFAKFRDEWLSHLWILCKKCPLLTNIAYIKPFALIANFLWKGDGFQVIEQIEEYQNFYYQQIEMENNNPTDVFPFRLTDYQIFDVSVMHSPQVIDESLHFFVYHALSGLPYRVVCPFPYTSLSTLVHYQILPLKNA